MSRGTPIRSERLIAIALEDLGLEWREGTWVGRLLGVRTQLSIFSGEDLNFYNLEFELNWPQDLRCHFAGSFGALVPALLRRSRSAPTGDDALDATFSIFSKDPEVPVALLNAKARGALAVLGSGTMGWQLRDGSLKLSETSLGAVALKQWVRKSAELAAQMVAAPVPVEQLLFENACADPNPKVRAANLAILKARYARGGGVPKLSFSARRALKSGDPSAELAAAVTLGPEGLETLSRLAFDSSLPAVVRVGAIDALEPSALSGDTTQLQLQNAFAEGERGLSEAAVRALLRSGGKPSEAAVTERFGLLDKETRQALLRKVGLSEATLIRLFAAETDDDVTQDFLEKLGEVGGLEAAHAITASLDRLLRRQRVAADQALEQIRQRVGGSGRLTVSEEESGHLSEAEGAGGLSEE